LVGGHGAGSLVVRSGSSGWHSRPSTANDAPWNGRPTTSVTDHVPASRTAVVPIGPARRRVRWAVGADPAERPVRCQGSVKIRAPGSRPGQERDRGRGRGRSLGLSCPGGAMFHTPKRLFVGRPLRSDRIGETLLPKWLALPVFCSDPLSSVAYAT